MTPASYAIWLSLGYKRFHEEDTVLSSSYDDSVQCSYSIEGEEICT